MSTSLSTSRGHKPEKAKLFSLIERRCSIRITGLHICERLTHADTLFVGVRLPGRSTMRSKPVPLPSGDGPADISVDIAFAIRYIHILKGGSNVLRISLQRPRRARKHKNLALVLLDLSYVLQTSVDEELHLHAPKAPPGSSPTATIRVRVTSDPVNLMQEEERRAAEIGGEDDVPDQGSEEEGPSDDEESDEEGQEEVVVDAIAHESLKSTGSAVLEHRLPLRDRVSRKAREAFARFKESRKGDRGNGTFHQGEYWVDDEYVTTSDEDAGIQEASPDFQGVRGDVALVDPLRISHDNLPEPSSQDEPSSPRHMDEEEIVETHANFVDRLQSVLGDLNGPVDEYVLPPRVVLIDASSRRGRQMIDIAKRADPEFALHGCAMAVLNPGEVRSTVSSILTACNRSREQPDEERPFRVGICGGDAFIGMIVRMFVNAWSSRPRGFESLLRFYLMPVGGKRNSDIALEFAQSNPKYRALFFAPEWKDPLDRRTGVLSNDEVREIARRASVYLTTPNVAPVHPLPIGEVIVTHMGKKSACEEHDGFREYVGLSDVEDDRPPPPSSVEESDESGKQVIAVPFIRSLDIGWKDELVKYWGEEGEAPEEGEVGEGESFVDLDPEVVKSPSDDFVQMQLTGFRVKGDKGEGGKVIIKGPFHFVAVTSTLRVAQGLRLQRDSLPIAGALSMVALYTEKKGRVRKKKQRIATAARVSKVICTSTEKGRDRPSSFMVRIDDTCWHNITLLTVSPQWAAQHLHSLPVALPV